MTSFFRFASFPETNDILSKTLPLSLAVLMKFLKFFG